MQRVSLQVSYVHLSENVPILAIWLADAPTEMLEIFDEVRFVSPGPREHASRVHVTGGAAQFGPLHRWPTRWCWRTVAFQPTGISSMR